MKQDYLKLENQLCFPLYLCSKEIIRKYSTYLEEFNLTYTQYVVMLYLWEKGNTNVRMLGKTLLLDSSTLTPLLKKLESKGYIKRKRSLVDERNLDITLTDAGVKLKNKVLSIPEIMKKEINLTDEEEKGLCAILYRILANIEKE